MGETGQIIILNGAPRSGKSSIVEVIQELFEGAWMNLGVDVFSRRVTPPRYQPGIGLRPGGERPAADLPTRDRLWRDPEVRRHLGGPLSDVAVNDRRSRPYDVCWPGWGLTFVDTFVEYGASQSRFEGRRSTHQGSLS